MSVHSDIKDTLDSPGAKHILRAMRNYHKSQWRRLKVCRPEELQEIQAVMTAIDSALPAVIEKLMNQHLNSKKDKDESLWFRFETWLKKFRYN